MAELIADCAELPRDMQAPEAPAPHHEWRDAPPWEVGDACVVRIAGMDEYGC